MHSNKLMMLSLTLILLLAGCQNTLEPVEVTEAITPIESGTLTLPELVTYDPIPYDNKALFLDHIQSGGVPLDGIPSIDEPIFVPINDAKALYQDNDPMFIVTLEGQTYLYPQSILVWHEIVNMDDYDLAVTYCPLTGSCITYRHPDHLDSSFGTSGNLLNSNLVMYDRVTGSNISQIDGIAFDNDLESFELETVATYWIDFGTAKDNFPQALVLSEQTGYLRNYTRDPYGSYTSNPSSNYYQSEGVMFPLIHTDDHFNLHDKEVVIGIKHNGLQTAIVKSSLDKNALLSLTINDTEMTAVYDPTINNTRVFIGSFSQDDSGNLLDSDGDLWARNGKHLTDQRFLESPIHFEVMWFAWYGFYPDTEVIQ